MSTASDETASTQDSFRKAVEQFDLNQHHEKIYDDPNILIDAGFSAEFLLPLVRAFHSSDGYQYFRRGELVDEMIGISHMSLVYAIGERLGVPSDAGSEFTGRGFAMRAVIEAIKSLFGNQKKRREVAG